MTGFERHMTSFRCTPYSYIYTNTNTHATAVVKLIADLCGAKWGLLAICCGDPAESLQEIIADLGSAG